MATVELWMLFVFFGFFPNPIASLCFPVPVAAAFIHKLSSYLFAVLRIRIRIRRIRVYLGLPDPHPDPLVTSTDQALDPATAPDPSFIKQNSKKNIDSNFLWLYNFLSLKNDVNAPVVRIRICNWIQIRMFLGLPDPHPDPSQYVTDPPHCILVDDFSKTFQLIAWIWMKVVEIAFRPRANKEKIFGLEKKNKQNVSNDKCLLFHSCCLFFWNGNSFIY